MTSLPEILDKASANVTPSKEETERLGRLAKKLMASTAAAAKSHWEVREVVMGGSYAKGTWLPGDVDIDLFVRISPNVKEPRFEQVGLAIGVQATAGYPRGKKYAQHPYTEATIDGVKVNVVPCYEVEPPNWRSAADRSPYHVKLVERLPERTKLQIRLLKRFMKAIGVYGAEIETQGFSGYVAEVLLMRHEDFAGVLEFFANFKPFSEEEFMHLPDPVDEGRDLARAISREKIGRMVLACRALLARPSESFFKDWPRRRRSSVQPEVIGLLFDHQPLSEDTLWGELKKTLKHIVAHAESRGFKITRSLAASNGSDSSGFLLLPGFRSLPKLEERLGPSVNRRSETDEFMSKNSRKAKLVWVGDDARVRLLQERKYTKLADLLSGVIAAGGVNVGASRGISPGIAKSGRVVSGYRLERLCSSSPWMRKAMDELVSDTFGTGPA